MQNNIGGITTSLPEVGLSSYIKSQINNFFPDEDIVTKNEILELLPSAFKRLEYCFSKINNKYYFDGSNILFHHLNGDQYSMFLYLMSHEAYKNSANNLAAKIYLLNKTLHSLDIYYEVELPSVFMFVHPLGTVLGRAEYADYLLVYQRCGVGSNHEVYPKLGKYTTLRPGSSILGNAKIGYNCTFAAESFLLDKDLNANSIYYGTPKNFSIKESKILPSIWRDQ
jgi:serine O-acetyltransferase